MQKQIFYNMIKKIEVPTIDTNHHKIQKRLNKFNKY